MASVQEQAWTYRDRTGWYSGEWDNEPDKIQWVDETTDLDCLIVRGPSGALCGYVGVPSSHPWHGRDFSSYDEEQGYLDDSPGSRVDVHGGLTYAAACQEGLPEGEGICHIPLPGREPDVWWFGFDCAHSMDVTPRRIYDAGPYAAYRTVGYVRSEAASLAKQLAEVAR